MTPDELRASFEEELAWRQEEVAFFKNQLNQVALDQKERYRKSMILILYSHLEGYIKICLQSYIQFLNALNLSRTSVNCNLVATSMLREFQAYDNLDRKCNVFSRELPDDTKFHRYYRRVDFANKFEEIRSAPLEIDDQIIDTESNLWYIVLQKNLFKVGLPIDLFAEYQRDIDALVNRRNSIAHGNFRSGVSEQEYTQWESKIYRVMEAITRILYDYAQNSRFLLITTST